MDKYIKAPIDKKDTAGLRAGDYVYITGTVYTACDAAHKRMYDILAEGGDLPIDLAGQVIYYMGPSRREAGVIGSAGLTGEQNGQVYAAAGLDGMGAHDRQRETEPGSD